MHILIETEQRPLYTFAQVFNNGVYLAYDHAIEVIFD